MSTRIAENNRSKSLLIKYLPKIILAINRLSKNIFDCAEHLNTGVSEIDFAIAILQEIRQYQNIFFLPFTNVNRVL